MSHGSMEIDEEETATFDDTGYGDIDFDGCSAEPRVPDFRMTALIKYVHVSIS